MSTELLEAIIRSKAPRAVAIFDQTLGKARSVWDIHLSLFPAAQRVLNPPFINPHLPKMHAIYREFLPYLDKDDIPSLVRLEVNEYARQDKLGELPRPASWPSAASFEDIERAIGQKDWKETASRMAAFLEREGPETFARRLLLLGSGYLNHSLGHSFSCTAFILLEMMERADQDPWPVLVLMADYFCKGGFLKTPELNESALLFSEKDYLQGLQRAISGKGIVNLHHTITLYAIERTRHLFTNHEYGHLLAMWAAFMKGKEAEPLLTGIPPASKPEDFSRFLEVFSRRETFPILNMAARMISSERDRKELGRFLVKGVCQLYQGNYDPHFITGLGSALWVMERFRDSPAVVVSALHQYLDYYFAGIQTY
jgi:hypothetical protein